MPIRVESPHLVMWYSRTRNLSTYNALRELADLPHSDLVKLAYEYSRAPWTVFYRGPFGEWIQREHKTLRRAKQWTAQCGKTNVAKIIKGSYPNGAALVMY